MLLDALYAQPLINPKSSRSFAELARKFDIPSLATFWTIVSSVTLDTGNLSGWHRLADDYAMSEAAARCRKFAVGSNFKKIKL